MYNLMVCLLLIRLILFTTLLECQGAELRQTQFYTLHKWSRGINMTFPTAKDREHAVNNGYYNINRTQIPVDIELVYKEKNQHHIFLTIPRLNYGVPYTLAIIKPDDHNVITNPRVEPYPNYDWHKSHGMDCASITSALRIYIDECNRLWVMDSGQISSLQWCAPQLLVFDLKTHQLIHRYKFPSNNYKAGISVYTDMVVDVKYKTACLDAMVYIPDAWGHGLIVYSLIKQKSWRIEHDLMKPEKAFRNNVHDGIFTVSLSPKIRKERERYLYFHSLNSFQEIRIPLKYVNNESLWYFPKGYSLIDNYFSTLGARGLQCESETMDKYGNLYCSILGSSALIRWKEGRNYTADDLNVVAFGPKQWRFVTALKLSTNSRKQQELWALSTEPKLFTGNSFPNNTTMFQIMGCRIRNLLRSEICTVGVARFK